MLFKGYDEMLANERRYFEVECLKKVDAWKHSPYTIITKNARAAYIVSQAKLIRKNMTKSNFLEEAQRTRQRLDERRHEFSASD